MSHHHSDVLKPKEVVRILEHLGFEHVRNHGSHQHFRDAKGGFSRNRKSGRQWENREPKLLPQPRPASLNRRQSHMANRKRHTAKRRR